MTDKIKTPSSFLGFFRVNRLLSYLVLSMVLPSIAWPATGEGPDYAASRTMVSHGLPVTGASLAAALAASGDEKATRVAFPARGSNRGNRTFTVIIRSDGAIQAMEVGRGTVVPPPPAPDPRPRAFSETLQSQRFTGINPMAGRAARASVAQTLGLSPVGSSEDPEEIPGAFPGAHIPGAHTDSKESPARPYRTSHVLGLHNAAISAGAAGIGPHYDPRKPKALRAPRDSSPVNGAAVADLETGTPATATSPAATPPTKAPISAADMAILKPLNDYMLRLFNPNITRRDAIQYTVTFVLTGLVCVELWGEGKMMIDRSFTALLAKSPQMAQYLLYDPAGAPMKIWASKLILANCGIALAPYLPYRLYKVVKLMTPGAEWALKRMYGFLKPYLPRRCTAARADIPPVAQKPLEKPLAKTVPLWADVVGQALVLVGAVANGALPAYVSYNANYLFGNQLVYAHTVPPFLFIFYTIDYFLRLQTLKNKLFNWLFVTRGDPVAKERAGFIDRLREAKYVVNKQKSGPLLELHGRLKSLSEKGEDVDEGMARGGATAPTSLVSKEGMDELEILLGLAKPKVRAVEKIKSTMHYVRQYGPLLWAAILCLCGAYLVGRVSYGNFGGTIQYLATGQPDSSLADRIYYNEAINYAAANTLYLQQEVPLWPNITGNVTVYNGEGTDWCWQCFGPGNYQLGDESNPAAVPINFLQCPGVLPTGFTGPLAATVWTASLPQDLIYSADNCESWFNYFASNFQTYDPTGALYFQQYVDVFDPHLDPTLNITSYTLSTGGQVVAGGGAFVSALAAYGMGILATTGFLQRWINSYRSHPEDVLPFKRNVYLTTATMGWALLQSLFRSAPVLISGLITMKDDQINPGFMWIILSAAMFTGAATYFPDFDEAYGHLPKWIGNDIPRVLLGIYNGVRRMIYSCGTRGTEHTILKRIQRILHASIKPRPDDASFNLFGKKAGDLVFPKRDWILIKIDELRAALAGADSEIIRALVRGLGDTLVVSGDRVVRV